MYSILSFVTLTFVMAISLSMSVLAPSWSRSIKVSCNPSSASTATSNIQSFRVKSMCRRSSALEPVRIDMSSTLWSRYPIKLSIVLLLSKTRKKFGYGSSICWSGCRIEWWSSGSVRIIQTKCWLVWWTIVGKQKVSKRRRRAFPKINRFGWNCIKREMTTVASLPSSIIFPTTECHLTSLSSICFSFNCMARNKAKATIRTVVWATRRQQSGLCPPASLDFLRGLIGIKHKKKVLL
mmetsp:Transcript_44782/g.108183  ORF Transcript_44782/g.108183 Transcript_44782/m.108183 type:complete len:237 (+) Transcript_44782:1597-2307(+)